MKKKLLLLSNVILLSSCNVFVNNSLPNEKKTIVGDFGNIVKDKVTITDENGHDFSNQKLMVKGTLNDTVDHLIIGDEVEIYYKDDSKTEIDHVFVIPAKIIKIEDYDIYDCASRDDINFYTDDYRIFANNAKYVVNQDFSYKGKEGISLTKKEELYGSFQKIEKCESDLYKGIIHILSLYSYLPR